MRISDWSSDVCSSDLIEIGKGFGEAEQLAIVVPVTVPAHVPAFDQNAAETVLRGKIDIALRFFGRGAVDAVMAPASLVDVHRPPDADILARFEPRRSEEHTSELQSLMRISYAVFCLKKKTTTQT